MCVWGERRGGGGVGWRGGGRGMVLLVPPDVAIPVKWLSVVFDYCFRN